MNWRESVPPLLVELADHATACLVEEAGIDYERAEHLGYLIMRRFAEAAGGGSVYVPKADSILRHERDLAIWAEFDGANHGQLARKYGVTEVHVYRVLKAMRAKDMSRRQTAFDL